MPRKLSSDNVFDTLEVEVEGNSYTMRSITRSISKKIAELERRTLEFEEDDIDGVAEAMMELIDMHLEPANGCPPVGALLKERWESDVLGLDWLIAFSTSLQEESQARRRPTSPTAKSR